MAREVEIPCIYVLAGTNGAGKSSIGGAFLGQKGTRYFDPDQATRRIFSANPGVSLEEANSAAWKQGKRLLERATAERTTFAIETTLGGRTISGLLRKALAARIEVRVWYVGLESPELHIARVRARVKKGGHDIPDAKIRERYHQSIWNLVQLLPKLTELIVYDNSEEADPHSGHEPNPKLILHVIKGKVISLCDLVRAPKWAKPVLMAAIKSSR